MVEDAIDRPLQVTPKLTKDLHADQRTSLNLCVRDAVSTVNEDDATGRYILDEGLRNGSLDPQRDSSDFVFGDE